MFQSRLENSYVETFYAKNTRVYTDTLQDILLVCNNSYHHIIGRVLVSVSLHNVGQVRRELYGKSRTKPGRELKFKLGDQVHISKLCHTFKNGYLPLWTQELCKVTKIIPRVSPLHVYQLRDYADDEIEDVFYVEELQKILKSDDIYKI